MADLNAHNLARCAECGKLIPLGSERSRCAECRGEAEPSAVEAVPFAHLTAESACARCRLRTRLDGSEFCLNCQVEVIAELDDTTRGLAEGIETGEAPLREDLGINAMYLSKRRSTPTSRINVVGAKPLRGQIPT